MNRAHTVSKESAKSDKGGTMVDYYDREFNRDYSVALPKLKLAKFKSFQKSSKALKKLNGYAVSSALDRKLILGIFGQLGRVPSNHQIQNRNN